MTSGGNGRRVLFSVPLPESNLENPYIALLGRGVGGAGWQVEGFSWPRALLGSYDVLHLHWPEFLVISGKGSALQQFVKQALSGLLVARLTARGTCVVETRHNFRPHDDLASPVSRWLLGRLEARVRRSIVMNGFDAAEPHTEPCDVIPHGTYRDSFEVSEGPCVFAPRLLFFGSIRPYKNVAPLVECFRASQAPGWTLTVAGGGAGPDLGRTLEELAGGDPRVELRLTKVPEDELETAVDRAGAVIAPYRELRNSGTVLLALSRNRPVILPGSDLSRELRDEFGPAWVFEYSGELTPQNLAEALGRVQATADRREGREVDMSRRDWGRVGAMTAACYDAALGQEAMADVRAA